MILVTGAAGYVGNNLVRRLVQAGKPVRAMVHSRAKAEARLADIRDKVDIVAGDVMRPETLVPALAGVNAVAHWPPSPSSTGRTPTSGSTPRARFTWWTRRKRRVCVVSST
jgi:uncharacterized protein YbjT (DUF2867 family)